MTVAPERPALPFTRPTVLELAPIYDVLCREAPVAAVLAEQKRAEPREDVISDLVRAQTEDESPG